MERGGTGIPPDRARENWGRNKDFPDNKPVILNMSPSSSEASGGVQRSSGGQRLPAPGEVREPRSQAEAVKMLELSQKLVQLGCQYLEPSLSNEVRLSTHNSDMGDIRVYICGVRGNIADNSTSFCQP